MSMQDRSTNMSNKNFDSSKIKDHMPIVASMGQQLGTVDHLDGNSIKVTKNEQGQHHWIPLSWVTSVDDHVHINKTKDEAMRDWMTSQPGTR